MPTQAETDARSKLMTIVAVVSMILALGAVLYAQITTNVIARQAAEFAKENRFLPEKVTNLEKRVGKNEEIVNKFGEMQVEYKHMLEDLKKIQRALERLVNGGFSTQKRE